MNKTLIIYDDTGYVLSAVTGSYRIPVGIPNVEVTIPEGKYVTSVDVTTTPHTIIYGNIPKSEELTRLELLEQAFNELTLGV